MNVAVLVPYRAGISDRDRLWRFCKPRWQEHHPEWDLVEGDSPDGPFCRAKAVNEAAAKAGDWDVALIIDADVVVDPHIVRSTVDVAYCTDGLVVASPERWMLSKQGTEKILAGHAGKWDSLVRTKYGAREDPNGAQASCCVAVSRPLWELVGGFDEMHISYGFEDLSFREACESMSGKATVWLAPHPIWHLAHEPSPDDRKDNPFKLANEQRFKRYVAAHGDREATQALIDEHLAAREPVSADDAPWEAAGIPRTFHRTVPEETSTEVEGFWAEFQRLHPGWEFRTWRDPLNPEDWPLTGDLFARCQNGAQLAGLVRLEALVTYGGVYVDSDVKPFRSFEPLLNNRAVVAWEDARCIPDAVMMCEPNHPAFRLALEKARSAIEGGGDAWNSGPGVTTEVMQNRDDVLVLGPSSWYDVHYLDRAKLNDPPAPYEFARHMWHASWLTPAQRKSQERRQRT